MNLFLRRAGHVLWASALVAATGCDRPAASAPGVLDARAAETAAVASTGARPGGVRARLRLETLDRGRVPEQVGYRERVAACEAAGLPVRALSPDQIARLGTAEAAIVYDAGHYLERVTAWNYRSPTGDPRGLCQFDFMETVDEYYQDDKLAGSTIHDNDTVAWEEAPIEGGSLYAVDAAGRDPAEFRAAGWSGPVARQVGGKPCEEWTSDQAAVCLWTGGIAWGLPAAPHLFGNDAVGIYRTALPLSQEPVDGSGTRISLLALDEGVALRSDDFRPRTRTTR